MATTPIVTEVTKAQLDALVAANGLNEGLQYKVTDKNWLLISTSVNTYKFLSIPFKLLAGFVTDNGDGTFLITEVVNEIGDVVWTYDAINYGFTGTLTGAFGSAKTGLIFGNTFNYSSGSVLVKASSTNDSVYFKTTDTADSSLSGEFLETYFEIKVYLI